MTFQHRYGSCINIQELPSICSIGQTNLSTAATAEAKSSESCISIYL